MRKPTISAVRALLALCVAAPSLALAQAAPGGACALSGSPSVRAEGLGMLRLGDVQGCPGLRYEIVPGVFIDGQPMVRLLPDKDCGVRGADSVTVDGAPASRTGDGCG